MFEASPQPPDPGRPDWQYKMLLQLAIEMSSLFSPKKLVNNRLETPTQSQFLGRHLLAMCIEGTWPTK